MNIMQIKHRTVVAKFIHAVKIYPDNSCEPACNVGNVMHLHPEEMLLMHDEILVTQFPQNGIDHPEYLIYSNDNTVTTEQMDRVLQLHIMREF